MRQIISIIIINIQKINTVKATATAPIIASAKLETVISIPKLKRTNSAYYPFCAKAITKIVMEKMMIMIPATIFKLSNDHI
ncbi:MAG: hypothetical protein ACFFBH_12375 [Promethearchaeota archaeon]